MIKQEDMAEFKGQIIDLFEDFLTERNIVLNNGDREQAIEDGEDPETLAVIYGSDYDELGDGLQEIAERWKLIDRKKKK